MNTWRSQPALCNCIWGMCDKGGWLLSHIRWCREAAFHRGFRECDYCHHSQCVSFLCLDTHVKTHTCTHKLHYALPYQITCYCVFHGRVVRCYSVSTFHCTNLLMGITRLCREAAIWHGTHSRVQQNGHVLGIFLWIDICYIYLNQFKTAVTSPLINY